MRRLLIYADVSVIGGCEDAQFAEYSRALWSGFVEGHHLLVLSLHTLRELEGAPEAVRDRIPEVPDDHVIVLADSEEAQELAEAYLKRGIVGPGARSDAGQVALAAVGRVDVIGKLELQAYRQLGTNQAFSICERRTRLRDARDSNAAGGA